MKEDKCPRCGIDVISEFYGPCSACVAALRSSQRSSPKRLRIERVVGNPTVFEVHEMGAQGIGIEFDVTELDVIDANVIEAL